MRGGANAATAGRPLARLALAALLAAAATGCRRRPPLPDRPIAALFALDDGADLERDDGRAPTTPIWDGSRVKLLAGRNEIVAFQLVVRAGKPGIDALSARLPVLAHAGAELRHAPPGPDPSDFRGRDIALYTVNYLPVTRATRADFIYTPGGADAPADPTGDKPVQLVPENARAGRGALPIAVAPGHNQALWFEIDTGRDRPAGLYRGTITVTAGGVEASVPVELELLDFALPDESPLTAMVYFEREQVRLYQGRDLDAAYHRFAHRHRIELVNEIPLAELPRAAARFDGSAFTPAAGYQGPGQGVGNRIVPASFYGPGAFADRARTWTLADAWMTAVAPLPRAITFLYLPDEPTPPDFPAIRALVEHLRANPGPGRKLPTLVTHEPHRDLAADIWCTPPRLYEPAVAARERAAGRAHWLYNGGRPHGPALVIDAPATDARLIGWLAFKAGVPVYFYWHAVHWRHNHQKKVGERNQDVWANPITFDSRRKDGKGDFANGDGVLLYPGTEVLHPAQDRGIAGPIGTVQLANLRRGLQDYLYLTLARERGHERLVAQVMEEIVPRAFAAASGRVSFPEEAARFEAARAKLARAIAGGR